MAEKKKSFVVETSKAALRGAASGGGLVGSVAGGVQAGVGATNRIHSGFQQFNKKQQQANKPVKKSAAPKVAPKAKAVSTKPVNKPAKPTVKKK